MILEVAILDVIPGQEEDFQQAFTQAEKILFSMPGYINHQLKICLEKPSRYILLVNWQKLEDHTEGFRGSIEYQEWKSLLHHFYQPFPEVEHYQDKLNSPNNCDAPGESLIGKTRSTTIAFLIFI